MDKDRASASVKEAYVPPRETPGAIIQAFENAAGGGFLRSAPGSRLPCSGLTVQSRALAAVAGPAMAPESGSRGGWTSVSGTA